MSHRKIGRKTAGKTKVPNEIKVAVDNEPVDAANLSVVARVAVLSRVFVVILTVLTNHFGAEYDTSTSLLSSVDEYCSALDHVLLAWINPFMHWDAVFNLDIALNGYSFEQQFAFFPGYPFLARSVSKILNLVLNLCPRTATSLSGLLISNIAFILAAMILYKLSRSLKFNSRESLNASVIFCINPASGFMSSFYTESLFALATFFGMLKLSKQKFLLAAFAFACAGMTRANGLLYAGFFVWNLIQFSGSLKARIYNGLFMITCAAISVAPFVWFQTLGARLFCSDGHNMPVWCRSTVPLIYSYVQVHYWNNGFLKYFTFSQIPNFLLASPMIWISSTSIYAYAKHDFWRFGTLCWKSNDKTGSAFFSNILLPYVYLTSVMLYMVTTMMHVQVIVRFFSCCPVIYWFLASRISQADRAAKVYILYSLIYGTIGITLFSNFLPPA